MKSGSFSCYRAALSGTGADIGGERDDEPAPRPATPPCRACGLSEKVICFPYNHTLTICPDCCGNADHPDGEHGHKWTHDKWERDWVCDYCGIPRRYTDYDSGGDL